MSQVFNHMVAQYFRHALWRSSFQLLSRFATHDSVINHRSSEPHLSMNEQQITKQAMARELRTSRSQSDRLLDPRNVSVSLDTMARAAKALGKTLTIRITDVNTGRTRRRTSNLTRTS
jgi:hypothetical protein